MEIKFTFIWGFLVKSEKIITDMLKLLASEEEPSKAQLQEINDLNKQLREKYIHVLGNSNIRLHLWDNIYGKPIRSNHLLSTGQWIAPNPNMLDDSPVLKKMFDRKRMVETSNRLTDGKAMLIFFNERVMVENVGVFPKEKFCIVLNPNSEELPNEQNDV